jgi:predicted outer membrane repeat protein
MTKLFFFTVGLAALGVALDGEAATLTINSTSDNLTSDNFLTLREAVVMIDNAGVTNTAASINRPLTAAEQAQISGTFGVADKIMLPAGTFQLAIVGTGEGVSPALPKIGDLDITVSGVTVQGAGAASTIIQQTSTQDRLFDVNVNFIGNFVFTLDGVTISGGRETSGVAGGGVFSGSSSGAASLTTIKNCRFINNRASGAGLGGGGWAHTGGDAIVTNCVFGGPGAGEPNSANTSGGAIYFDGYGTVATLTVTNCTFTNNIAGSGAAGGGAIDVATVNLGTGVYNIGGCTFSGNQATNAGGGAITIESGTLNVTACNFFSNSAAFNGGAVFSSGAPATVRYCRVLGNTAPSGKTFRASSGTFTANDNWWGVNSGPGVNETVGVAATTWLQLRHFPNPATINLNGTSTLTAHFLTNSAGTALTAGNLTALVGLPVTFGNAVRGNLSGAQTSIQSAGTATATFTGTSLGAGSADATVNSATVTAAITIVCPVITGAVSGGGGICAGGSTNVIVTITGGVAPYTVTLNNSGGTKTNTSPLTFTVNPASTTTYSVTSATDSTGCPASVSGSATVTVNALPTTPTITPTPASVCANSTGNQASSPTPASVCANSTGNQASGPAGATTYSWTISNGTITSATNIQTITYTAGASGNVGLTLRVSNASGCFATNSANVPINAVPATPTITPTPSNVNPNSTGNQAGGPGGATTYSWTISNGTITSATNIQTITYTAGASGNVGLTLRVSNASGCFATNSANVPINIPPAITSTNKTTFTVGINGTFTVTRTGTPTPDLFVSGTIPSNVGFNPGTGNLAGTPLIGTGGTYPLVITATNVAGTNVQNFTLTVLESPALSCPPNVTTNAAGQCPQTVAFSATVTHGYPTPTVTYKIGTNVISSPYAFPVGTNVVTVTATNGVPTDKTCSFTVTVLPGAQPLLTILPSGTNVVLCWSNLFACYALQYTPQLLSSPSTNVWTVHPGPFMPSGGNIYVTNGIGATNRFFRLAY